MVNHGSVQISWDGVATKAAAAITAAAAAAIASLLLLLMPPCLNIAAAAAAAAASAKLQPLQPQHCRRCSVRQICTTVAMVAKRNKV